jgi:hypothetical protein
MDRYSPHVRTVALEVAQRIGAECCRDAARPEVPDERARFDREWAAGLIADAVLAMVDEEREECAQIAEVLEPPGPETISDLIRNRASTS